MREPSHSWDVGDGVPAPTVSGPPAVRVKAPVLILIWRRSFQALVGCLLLEGNWAR